MSASLSKYLALIPPQNAGQPNFVAACTALLQGFADGTALMTATLPTIFDLDTAYQQQLDYTGQWIGVSRVLTTPLAGIYFSFDTPGLGFDQGAWLGPYDNPYSTTVLPDAAYRLLLKAAVGRNHWNGTIPGAYAIINSYLTPLGYSISIIDGQDMTMAYILFATTVDAITAGLYTGGFFDLRPAGVGVTGHYYATPGQPIFGFDIETTVVAGFDVGYWLSPNPPPIYVPPVVTPGAAQYQLPGTPAIVYSVRRLMSSYAGAAFRVRRDSDGSQADVGFTSSGDLDVAGLLAFVAGASGYVVTWYDQSGNGINATQSVTALQQRIVVLGTLEIKGIRAALHSLGADGVVVPAQTIGAPWSAFVVQGLDNTQNRRMLTANNSAAVRDWYLGYQGGYEEAVFFETGSAVARGAATPADEVYSVVSNLTAATGFADVYDATIGTSPVTWAGTSYYPSNTALYPIIDAVSSAGIRIINRAVGASGALAWKGDGNAYTYSASNGALLSAAAQSAAEATWPAAAPQFGNFAVSPYNAQYAIMQTTDGNNVVCYPGNINASHNSQGTGVAALYLCSGGPSGVSTPVFVADIIPVLSGIATSDTLLAIIPCADLAHILVITKNGSGAYTYHLVNVLGGAASEVSTGNFAAIRGASTPLLNGSGAVVGAGSWCDINSIGGTAYPLGCLDSNLTTLWISNIQNSQDLWCVKFNGTDWSLCNYIAQSFPTSGPLSAAPEAIWADNSMLAHIKGQSASGVSASIALWSFNAASNEIYRVWENDFLPTSFAASNSADPVAIVTGVTPSIRIGNRNPFTTGVSPAVNGDGTVIVVDPATGQVTSTAAAQNSIEAEYIVNGYTSGDQGAHRWHSPLSGYTSNLIDMVMMSGSGKPVVGMTKGFYSSGYAGGVWTFDYAGGGYLADCIAVCTPLPTGTGGYVHVAGAFPCADFQHVVIVLDYQSGTPTSNNYFYVVNISSSGTPTLVGAYQFDSGLQAFLGSGMPIPFGWWADTHYDLSGSSGAAMLESDLQHAWLLAYNGSSFCCVNLSAGVATQVPGPSASAAEGTPAFVLSSSSFLVPSLWADNGKCAIASLNSVAMWSRPLGSSLIGVYRDGVEFAGLADGIGSAYPPDPMYFGGQLVGVSDQHSYGTTHEFIAYRAALTNAQRQAIEFSQLSYYQLSPYANCHTNALASSASLADFSAFGAPTSYGDSGSALQIAGFAGGTQAGLSLSIVPAHSQGNLSVNVTVADPTHGVAPALCWLTSYFNGAPNSFAYALQVALVSGNLVLTLIRGSNSGGGANVVLATIAAGGASVGDIHRIEVDYNGTTGTHTVYLDGVQVGSVVDATYSAGTVGMFGVCTATTATAVAFDSLYLAWQ